MGEPAAEMSKLNRELVEDAVKKILAFSKGETIVKDGEEKKGKQRKFQETIELQVKQDTPHALKAPIQPHIQPSRC